IQFSKVQVVTGDKALLQNVKKLQSGRIDALVENEMVMNFSLRKYHIAGLESIGCEPETPLFVAFSPKKDSSQKIVKLIDEGLAEMRKSGRFAKILERYGAKDWADLKR
ncbi:MAG: transporter substrate-binding domain-containing protein, partial [Proteobacteria bacterium]|nr:transporter substrate-binding domain-containing protein [Pseudomonadota bacterium]